MTRDEWRRVKEIAGEALAQDAAAGEAFIAARCAGDESLCREVGSLLDSVHRAADLYETPSFDTTSLLSIVAADTEPMPMAGERIGAYRILSEIGRGGMGTAYLAIRDDKAFEKRVAIKLIKRGMDTHAILQRFRHERQILASLEHPNIVMLLDGGTSDDGLPYFIMEYVDGEPIDAYCSANTLGIVERLKLFQSVCAAVHHAHQRHVVHRDLKPTNILVTRSGVAKLLDFGIAKVLDPVPGDTEPTVFHRAMTPQYASPEQIRGETLTTSSDVYSLGVLLHVLLTGRHPHVVDGLSPREAERAICDDVPRKPSASVHAAFAEAMGLKLDRMRRELSGNLDAIVMTALSKRPEDRYESAQALADDIQRHLDGKPIAARPSRVPPRVAPALIAAAIIVAAAVGLIARYTTSTRPVAKAIAVMPFSADAGDAELEYISDGLTEDVIKRLSQSTLKVIARDSAYRYRGKPFDPRQVGRELGVDTILTGRVSRQHATVAIASELIDARDGRHLWGETYERGIGDLQSVKRDLAQRVAATLQVRFDPDDRRRFEREQTTNPEAYTLYLKGRYFWNKRTSSGLKTSVGYFTQAVDHDPSYALAYSGLADSYSLLTEYHAEAATETYAQARRAAERALAIDPNLAEAHTSRAYIRQFYEWDWSGAEQEFKRAIALNPTYATGQQWYAEYLSAMGRHDEALAVIRKAQEVDPLSLIVNAVEANLLYMAGRFEEAIEKSQKVIELEPNFPEVYEYLKRSYDQKGLYADAIATRQRRRTLLGLDARLTPALQIAAVTTTPRVYWQKRVEQELQEAKTEGLQPFEFAELLAQAGDTNRALEWLDRACAEHDFMIMYVRVAPNLAPLRADPRYQALLRRKCAV